MLPNWLYGKSKSKLASIIGGGGGTPADYNQVKAQVNQNTEDIALLNTSNQALTSQSNSIVNVLGAKNLLPNSAVSQTVNGVTFTVNSDGTIGISSANSEDNGGYEVSDEFLLKKGSYKLSRGLHSTPCPSLYIYKYSDNSIIAELTTDSTMEEVAFTLDTDTVLKCAMWYTANKAYDTTFYPMIRPASITDGTYVPYSMTNRELTEKLTADANLDTAVDLSTYSTYSNLYTAPSDGYVHFLSAASGSAARTIYTYGNNTTAAADPHFTHSTSVNNKAFEIFIKKGLKIYVDGLQSGDAINFYPLS